MMQFLPSLTVVENIKPQTQGARHSFLKHVGAENYDWTN